MIRFKNVLYVYVAGVFLVGCASSKPVDEAALAAATQLDSLQSSLAAMVKEHNVYIEDAAKLTVDEIDMLREIDIAEFFLQNKDQYVASLNNANVARVNATLPSFARSTLTAWQSREATRQSLRTQLMQMQEEAAQKIAVNFKKMRELRGKINALAAPKSNKDAMKFLAAYLREVDKELEKLKEEATTDGD